MTLKFAKLEYLYLARVASKLLLARKNVSAKDMTKGTNAIVKELAVKFSLHVEEREEYDVPLKRTHLRFLQEALTKSIEVIETRILPEYASRPNAAELKDYVDRMNDTQGMLTAMLAKINEAI